MTFIIAIIFVILYAGLNIYIGLKGYFVFSNLMPFFNSYLYWGLFMIIAFSIILGQLGRKFMPELMSSTFQIIGSYWIAAFEYLIIIYVLMDILNLFIKYQDKIANKPIILAINIFVLIFVAILLVYGTYHAQDTKIAGYNITIDKKAGTLKDLRVVMVSDIHLGEIVKNKRLKRMVDEINALNPDVVLLAGDIIDDRIEPFEKNNMAQYFLKLKATYGVYGILGNHEYFGGDIKKIELAYKKAGINCLVDEVTKVDNSFYIIGRNDLSSSRGNQKRKTLEQLLENLDKNLPIILMDHQPNHFEDIVSNGVDLQYSGHTHGGQFFPNNLITHIIFEKDWGYLKKGNSSFIVSSGYGTWGPPIRIGTNSEIINSVIHFKK